MDLKLLTEAPWKALLTKHKLEDEDVKDALVAYQRTPPDKFADRRKKVDELVAAANALKRDKALAGKSEVINYLTKMIATAAALKTKIDEDEEDSKGPVIPPDAHTSRSSFVGGSVKELPVTKKIIDTIYPYFPKKYKVISGYLNAGDLYWKVNYHWDAMRTWLEFAKGHKEMSEDEQKQLAVYYNKLMANAPSQTGHYKINKIGEPADSSSEGTIEQRCTMLKQLKADLTTYATAQKFWDKKMEKKQVLDYSLNPLALPKYSNHITGWALDIAGDINGAAAIARKLGATLAFKEFTHCHCEFKNGVRLPK